MIQKIIFGSPGTGKSHKIKDEIKHKLNIDHDSINCIKAVFHPEYGYGDFMGKLLPYTRDKKVEYNYYPGHFLKALAQALKNILENPETPNNVVLIIDEINRGNSAAIFGPIFQLLDREEDGWSTYSIELSNMEHQKMLEMMGIQKLGEDTYRIDRKPLNKEDFNELIAKTGIKNRSIHLPQNLSIISTMNTSDNSIYYMDSAFKRRWEWEFIDVNYNLNQVDDKKIYDCHIVSLSTPT